jgi:CubicO group peptidase (beta-lactamase class C family)
MHVSPLNTARLLTALLIFQIGMAHASADSSGLTAFVERGMELWNVPGMAVTVVTSDSVVFQKGFGETAVRDGAAVDEHTQFANASTTKAMVAAGMLMLVDESRLGLDDLVIDHLPELHFQDPLLNRQVTVRDLLTHRTGLPRTDFWTFMQGMPLEEQIERLASVKPAAPLRARHIYQNTMYEIAGLIIERLTGQRWDRFLAERLWRPIGMKETFGARGQIPSSLAHVMPHNLTDGTLTLAEWDLPADEPDAAGSVWSSIHDMGLWAQFLLRGGITADGERLLSEASYAEMFRPQSLIAEDDFYPTVRLTEPYWRTYGLGWFQQDFQGRKIEFHTGSLQGLIAIIGLDLADDRAVVVFGNRDHAEMRHAVLWEVMDQRPADTRIDWNQAVYDLYQDRVDESEARWEERRANRLSDTRPGLPLEAYAGRYDSPILGKVTVVAADGQLTLRTAKVDFSMSHWHLDTFLVEYQPWTLREFAEFHVAPDASVTGMKLLGETLVRVGDKD